MEDRTRELKKIRDEIWKLKTSPLYEYRKKNNYYPVIGEGSHYAKIMMIGEAPGKNEAKTGRHFCGAAGRILDKLFQSTSIKREEVYVSNIVKDRPPDNRDPSEEEIKTYSPFLVRQINIIKPKVIATLGRFSMYFIMEHFALEEERESISRVHGKVFQAKSSYGEIKIVPLYHPAVGIYNINMMPKLEEDFKKLEKLIKE